MVGIPFNPIKVDRGSNHREALSTPTFFKNTCSHMSPAVKLLWRHTIRPCGIGTWFKVVLRFLFDASATQSIQRQFSITLGHFKVPVVETFERWLILRPRGQKFNVGGRRAGSRRKPFMFNPSIFSRNCSAILTSSFRSGSMGCSRDVYVVSRHPNHMQLDCI
jgi:hypothetical protein